MESVIATPENEIENINENVTNTPNRLNEEQKTSTIENNENIPSSIEENVQSDSFVLKGKLQNDHLRMFDEDDEKEIRNKERWN